MEAGSFRSHGSRAGRDHVGQIRALDTHEVRDTEAESVRSVLYPKIYSLKCPEGREFPVAERIADRGFYIPSGLSELHKDERFPDHPSRDFQAL